MLEFQKIYCHCRSAQPVTNFCNKQQCQIGLCAVCICEHTTSHVVKGVPASYENIKTTYARLAADIEGQVRKLEALRGRIGVVEGAVGEKRQAVRETVRKAKQDVERVVRGFFEKLEQGMLKSMEVEDKANELHCQYRLDALKTQIHKEISGLLSLQVTAQNFLSSLPRIKNQILLNSSVLAQQIDEQVVRNQRYGTSIAYNQNILGALQNTLQNLVTLQFNKTLQNPSRNLQQVSVSLNGSRVVAQQQNKIVEHQMMRNQSAGRFTLRRPQSQGRIPNVVVDDRGEPTFRNVFENPSFRANFSPRVEMPIQNIHTFRSKPQYHDANLRKVPQTRTRLEDMAHFTFGSRVKENSQASSRPKPEMQNISIANVSQIFRSTVSQQFNPPTFNNFSQEIKHDDSDKKNPGVSNPNKKSGIKLISNQSKVQAKGKENNNISYESTGTFGSNS